MPPYSFAGDEATAAGGGLGLPLVYFGNEKADEPSARIGED